MRKATEEINRLREELSSATRENIQLKVRIYRICENISKPPQSNKLLMIFDVLKEEGLRLRRNNVSSGSDSTGFKSEQPPSVYRQHGGQDSAVSVTSPNVLYIVVALLLGIIIAKLFF